MAQIFNECEKYGFALLDDGIYQNDVKLGEVGRTDAGWWVMRSGECTAVVLILSAGTQTKNHRWDSTQRYRIGKPGFMSQIPD